MGGSHCKEESWGILYSPDQQVEKGCKPRGVYGNVAYEKAKEAVEKGDTREHLIKFIERYEGQIEKQRKQE